MMIYHMMIYHICHHDHVLQVLTINVKPGWKSGTKITFQREGDQVSFIIGMIFIILFWYHHLIIPSEFHHH